MTWNQTNFGLWKRWQWWAGGFTPAEAVLYSKLTTLSEAKRWKKAKASYKLAKEWIDSGYNFAAAVPFIKQGIKHPSEIG